ncbi:hypothetical protein P7K49_001490, partial [Saguinus oedipus]
MDSQKVSGGGDPEASGTSRAGIGWAGPLARVGGGSAEWVRPDRAGPGVQAAAAAAEEGEAARPLSVRERRGAHTAAGTAP